MAEVAETTTEQTAVRSFRLPVSILAWLDEQALAHDRSVNWIMVSRLRQLKADDERAQALVVPVHPGAVQPEAAPAAAPGGGTS